MIMKEIFNDKVSLEDYLAGKEGLLSRTCSNSSLGKQPKQTIAVGLQFQKDYYLNVYRRFQLSGRTSTVAYVSDLIGNQVYHRSEASSASFS